jgi:hypothetical protein
MINGTSGTYMEHRKKLYCWFFPLFHMFLLLYRKKYIYIRTDQPLVKNEKFKKLFSKYMEHVTGGTELKIFNKTNTLWCSVYE